MSIDYIKDPIGGIFSESQTKSQFKMMLPDELRSKLDVAACVNGTSASREAIRIIEEYFENKGKHNCEFYPFSSFPEGMNQSAVLNELRNNFAKVYSLIAELSARLYKIENKS